MGTPLNLDEFTRCDRCGAGYIPKGAPDSLPCPSVVCMENGRDVLETVHYPPCETLAELTSQPLMPEEREVRRWVRLPVARGKRVVGMMWRERT